MPVPGPVPHTPVAVSPSRRAFRPHPAAAAAAAAFYLFISRVAGDTHQPTGYYFSPRIFP